MAHTLLHCIGRVFPKVHDFVSKGIRISGTQSKSSYHIKTFINDPLTISKVLRLVTELLPSTLAAASKESIPPVVSMLAYLTLLLFGLAQLSTMWKPIATLLGDSPSGILLSCVTALFLGIPLATESGISIIHFLDTVIGGAWWLL